MCERLGKKTLRSAGYLITEVPSRKLPDCIFSYDGIHCTGLPRRSTGVLATFHDVNVQFGYPKRNQKPNATPPSSIPKFHAKSQNFLQALSKPKQGGSLVIVDFSTSDTSDKMNPPTLARTPNSF
jgi:hypothetical protein